MAVCAFGSHRQEIHDGRGGQGHRGVHVKVHRVLAAGDIAQVPAMSEEAHRYRLSYRLIARRCAPPMVFLALLVYLARFAEHPESPPVFLAFWSSPVGLVALVAMGSLCAAEVVRLTWALFRCPALVVSDDHIAVWAGRRVIDVPSNRIIGVTSIRTITGGVSDDRAFTVLTDVPGTDEIEVRQSWLKGSLEQASTRSRVSFRSRLSVRVRERDHPTGVECS